jgi:hypothetical protein
LLSVTDRQANEVIPVSTGSAEVEVATVKASP